MQPIYAPEVNAQDNYEGSSGMSKGDEDHDDELKTEAPKVETKKDEESKSEPKKVETVDAKEPQDLN